MIVGQNSTLNQYVPTFYIKNLTDGQGLLYDSVRRAFVNTDIVGGTGVNRLGQLLDVSDSEDNPLALVNGQALVYNSFTSLWENTFIDYDTLLNAPVIPTNSSFSFAGLSDTAKPSLPNGYVLWDSTGTQLTYSTTIPASSITGLATVATTGNYNDLINKPTIGSVTNVSIVTANGVSGSVSNPTTTPAITLTLGAITPTSIATSGSITASNLSGTNTGDQTIILTGDVAGSGTGNITSTLATVNSNVGTFGTSTLIPVVTVDGKGRITAISTVAVQSGSSGTVTSVSATGNNGVSITGSPITTSGTIAIGLNDITPTSVVASGSISGSNLSGTNTGDQTITLTGDVTGSGTSSFVSTLATVNSNIGTFGSGTQVPVVTVNAKGLVTGVTNTTITGSTNTLEIIVFRYSSGGSGNFSAGDAIYSQTPGVTTTITDAANCIASYSFTGKSHPPKSITLYGQNFTTNTFSITGMPGPNAANANLRIAGGGTSAAPDLANGIFTAANLVTLQTTMAFVGASSTLGNRAYLVVVFGF